MAKKKEIKTSQKQMDYIHDFDRQNYVRLTIRIRKDDKLVLDRLKKVESKSGYIIDLIRKDLVK